MIKRTFDILLSGTGLILLTPVFIIVALIIKSTSKGPVLYKQIRVGQYGEGFSILKFRTMKIESDTKGLLTVGNRDPRVTKVGYFLRKYKIDELPQLINVFKGEMSLVGPRPEVPKYVSYYSEEDKIILTVKPGITDFASIHFRNENELLRDAVNPELFYIKEIIPKKIELNKKYIRQRTPMVDLKIIFQTINSIFSKKK